MDCIYSVVPISKSYKKNIRSYLNKTVIVKPVKIARQNILILFYRNLMDLN